MESKAPSLKPTPITLYKSQDICLTCEEYSGIPFLHCEVETYNKSVAKELKGVWQEMEEAFIAHGHTEVFAYAKPQPAKFAKQFGNAEVIDKIDYLGEEYEVIKWALL